MTNKEAIELIKHDRDDDIFVTTEYRKKLHEAQTMSIYALEQTQWIPVSERYPKIEDEYKYFLVIDSKGKMSVQEFFISLDEDPQPYFSGMVDVIAWMSLPKPYEPQESEDKE